jgi:hypothetical protein
VELLLDRIAEAHAEAVRELAAALPDLHEVFDDQLAKIVHLVDRARQLPAVRADRDLLAELSELDGEDPRQFLDVLAVVLNEAYGEERLARFDLRAPVPDAAANNPWAIRSAEKRRHLNATRMGLRSPSGSPRRGRHHRRQAARPSGVGWDQRLGRGGLWQRQPGTSRTEVDSRSSR